MMASASANVTVKQLKLLGRESDIATARQQLPDTLQRCPWPETSEDEIILIRHLRIQKPFRQIGLDTVEQTIRLRQLAIDADAPGASSAEAVRFRSKAHWQARLIQNLLMPSSEPEWYWRSQRTLFEGPADYAISDLLCSEPLLVPEVFVLLPSRSRHAFWRILKPGQVFQILQAIARVTGWTDLPDENPASPASTSQVNGATRFRLETESLMGSPDDRAIRLKQRLAAVILLWQKAPHLLEPGIAPRAMAQVIRQSFPDTQTGLLPDDQPAREAASKPTGTRRDREPQATSQPDPTPMADDGKPQTPKDGSSPVRLRQSESGAETTETQRIEADEGPGDFRDHGIVTTCGGLFFLLNFLNLQAAKRIWRQAEPLSGWLWLHHLALQLGCEPDPPLQRFLAIQFDPTDPDALVRTSVPDSLPQLGDYAQKRYGETLWQEHTFCRSARLIADQSHISVHFPMRAVDLHIRRHGLDIDPGWLDWLGRVVRFYYGSGLEPGGER